jgi:deoxyribonuclease V
MIFAIDVYYQDKKAIVAGIAFHFWDAPKAAEEVVIEMEIDRVGEYEPGQFYKRELPCILALLETLETFPDIIVIDGYVYLGHEEKPGLGKRLYDAIDGKAIVIGVAKTRFQDTPASAEVYRGDSNRPLYVTAIGITETEAKGFIMDMHGEHRIPMLLKQVDRLTKLDTPN